MSISSPDTIRSDIGSLMRIWELAGPMRSNVAKGILFRFAQSICLGLSLGAVLWVVTGLADGRPLTLSWICRIIGLLVFSLSGQLLFGYLSAANSWLSSFELAGELRLSILDRLRRLPMGFHLSRHNGDTVTVLTSDMQMLENFLSDGLPRIAQVFSLPLMILLFLLWRDWVVALAALVSIALAMPIFFWSSRHLATLGILRQDRQAAAAARMIEYVQGMSVIRAFNRTAERQESFRLALEDFRAISRRMVLQLTAPLVAFGAILMMGVPMVMIVASLRYFGSAIDQGTAIAMLVLVFSIYPVLLGLVSVMELMRIADASLTRIDRIMMAECLPQSSEPRHPCGFAVRFEAVSFSYLPGKPVLKSISFDVPERSITAIVGPSGSGKSTILNLLPRFWEVEHGGISIGGADVRDIGEERLNQLITVVFQDAYLFAGTILDNIAIGKAGASKAEIEAAASAAQAHEFIMTLPDGFLTRIGEGGATLSGGERQRIAIARAILKDAPIILLDEVTAAIDATNECAIQEALARLVADKTLIVVAHKLSTIRAADHILVLENGYIEARGTHDCLIAAEGLYRKLWRHRAQAAQWRVSGQL